METPLEHQGAEANEELSSNVPGPSLPITNTRLSGDALESVRFAGEELGRRLAGSLSALLNCNISVRLAEITDSTFDAFLRALHQPRCLGALQSSCGDASALLSIDSALLSPMLETLLGGAIEEPTPLERPLTELELELLQGSARTVAAQLGESWKKYAKVEFQLVILDGGEMASRAVAPKEANTVLRYELDLAGAAQGNILLALPWTLWSRLLNADPSTDAEPEAAQPQPANRMLDLLLPAGMHLEVLLQRCEVSLGDLLALEPGKVLLLDQSLDTRFTGLLNGAEHYEGQIVSRANKRAFLVERIASDTHAASGLPLQEPAGPRCSE